MLSSGKIEESETPAATGQHELGADELLAAFAIGHLVEDLASRFADSAKLVGWFGRLTDDMVENVDCFRGGEAETALLEPMAASARRTAEQFFGRYEPNVLVSHGDGDGAPVVYETNPSHYNLFGRLDYEAGFGAVSTDATRSDALGSD